MNALFQPPWTRGSDDEYITRLRRKIASLDRHRFWFVGYFVLLILFAVWLYSKVIEVLLELAPNVPLALGGFIVGAILGLGCGLMFSGLVLGMVSSLTGFRAERLLLKYHDAIGESSEGEASQNG